MSALPDVIVIGAGVIGLSAALALQAEGRRVVVLDREGPAAGASAGNAGAFAFTDILPLASPGILRKASKWLLDPLGPLSVPPAYALRIAPWMFRFWRACAPHRVAQSTAAQTALMDLSKALLEPFLERTGTLPMLRKDGNLQVYEGEAEFRASLAGWQARAGHGIDFHHMNAREMAEIQPGIAPRFTHGTFTPGWYSISDPKLYTLALAERFVAGGGRIDQAEARALRPVENGIEVTAGTTLRAGHVVLAAGAFSHRIARTLGERIPLETERGYNTTLPASAFDLRTQITFGGHGFVITRLSSGIRVGGAVELGGLDLPPNFGRSRAMLGKAKTFLPGLDARGGTEWMGFRPSLPDSLPVIGVARETPRVVYAFGHGHLGLTQSVGTARLVADLVAGRKPAIDLSPFSPRRF
ncbi:NAD(P)/FAD-dependent oxidoreductase [Aquamicrobium defluvii]|uniref:Amino acid dehydrogenase n=1 Tax=Aquamicrobium defluvii TaxID=69279 RepID=A0A011UHW5_9HYPH|nr:amino acid dehydrogenase [Aquamicrobium defluvii]EZQ14273.1 amino acid dehydrogenase [Halopseudomonas bauzanensis]TDR35280.1 glycine/D-amino acid oxidase-like deaminating enzyme [Aquamicrobium defluvii]